MESNIYYLPGITQVTTEQIDKATKLKPAMSKMAGVIWDRLAPQMISLERLKPHFVDMFAEYCYLLARIAEKREELEKIGETYEIEGRNGAQIKSHPYLAQLNDDWRKLARLSGCFGLTPSDEKTLINTSQQSIIDEFAQFG